MHCKFNFLMVSQTIQKTVFVCIAEEMLPNPQQVFITSLHFVIIRLGVKIFIAFSNFKYSHFIKIKPAITFSSLCKKTLILLKLPQISALHRSPVSQCTPSFKQQSQWIILSSICYCMAEGSYAVHTCPATCWHHWARAGCDSVCQCLQWSDYTPVFRHVPPVCSPTNAAVYICPPSGGWGNRAGAGAGNRRDVSYVSNNSRHLFIFPHTPAPEMSVVLLQPLVCSSARRGREGKRWEGEGKKSCAVQTQFCMQYWRAPVRRG